MANTSEKLDEIKGLRAQIKARMMELKEAADKIKEEKRALKDHDSKLKDAAKAEREAIKTRAAQAKADKAAKKEREAREKAEAKANRTRGRRKAEQPKKEAPRSESQKKEDGLAASVAAELMRDYKLHAECSVQQIRNIRRAYARKYHPDLVGGDGKRMQIANVMLDGAEKTAKWKAQRAEAA